MSRRQTAAALAAGAACCALILADTAALRADLDYGELTAYRRLWTDLALGVSGYLDARYPPAQEGAASAVAARPVAACREIVLERIARRHIKPWQFWRILRDDPFLRERIAFRAGPYDDPGRGLVLAAAFRARGGVAPFLLVWLGTLCAVPVVVWTAVESFRARVPVAGMVFLAGLGLWPFALESLALARSAAGFYLLALLALVPVALYGTLGDPTPRGAAGRWAAAGLVLGIAALCRSSALFTLPAFALALALTVRRLAAPTRRARLATAAACAAALLAPWALVRQPQHHDVWAAVWEGLGDFDRTKGHAWSDPVADDRVRRDGAPGRLSPEGMALMKKDVVDHVRGDPGWYAAILARRAFAVITQQRLWPSVRADGTWVQRSTSANEGFMDKYYDYTTTADFVGFGDRQVELPVALLVLPTLGLLAWAAADRRLRSRAAPVLVLMAAALPLPVLVTTAGGAEPQAFAVAYGLGFSLLADALVARLRQQRRSETNSLR